MSETVTNSAGIPEDIPPAAAEYIRSLRLEAHPEGGYFRRWHESPLLSQLDGRWPADAKRPLSSSIQYMLLKGQKSSLHKLKAEELYFWHAGGQLIVVEIGPDSVNETKLGPNPSKGEKIAHRVAPGTTFGSHLADEADWALVSCVVTPAFDFDDWEMKSERELLELYPHAGPQIKRLATDASGNTSTAP